jgi:serine/threonine protein kinase
MSLLREGAEYRGESGRTYLAVGPLGQANVFTAVDKDDHANIVVLKAPSADDTGTSWPQFQHEMIMHELLKNCPSIRKQVDRIPPVNEANTPPILVLEIFETTLWHARTKRPFSKAEVKSVARQILQGLKEVHDRELVYADLKMQNVMLNGFDNAEPGDGSNLIAKLGDLGIVMEPSKGKVQPVAYRAPEVFFKGEITPAIDVWAFGLIYCHLMEAITRFDKTGLYDDLYVGGGSMVEREQAMRHAIANDHDLQQNDYYKHCALPYRDSEHEKGQQWEVLRQRGLDEEDIEFVRWILNSDPRRRPSAADALESKTLDLNAAGVHEMARIPEGCLPGSLDGTQEERRTSLGLSQGSGFRSRRDANSVTPVLPEATMLPATRPEHLLRGVSQAVSTPGAGLPSGAQTPALPEMGRQDESDDGWPGVLRDAAAQNAHVPSNDTTSTVTPPDPKLNTANGLDASRADPGRLEHLQHIGRNSSNGGTWLSYR